MQREDYLKQADASKHWENRPSPVVEYVDLLYKCSIQLEGKKLLDVGCAEGIEVHEFNKLGAQAKGVDVKQDFVDAAKQQFPGEDFIVADAEQLPFADATYDIVFCINTLFYTDIEKSIPEFCRVLKRDGYGIVSFDTEIFNIDDDVVFHADTIDHLQEIISYAGAQIEHITSAEQRTDIEPFQHKHTFHKIVFKKVL